jgi:hypothetical protein
VAGAIMVRETIKFKRRSDALLFDQHLLRFLSYCESKSEAENSCLFSTCEQDERHHIRILQSDDTRMLGKLLNYLKISNFPISTTASSGSFGD